jgi:hypothetical protein
MSYQDSDPMLVSLEADTSLSAPHSVMDVISGQRPKAVNTLLALLVVSLETDTSLAKPVGLQWEGSSSIKSAMLKLDVLDLKVQTSQHQNCVTCQ